jgi:hypothetical protein
VQLVDLVREHPHSDLAHRILLLFQVISDKEPDRKVLVSCDIGPTLMPFLSEGFNPEARPTAQELRKHYSMSAAPRPCALPYGAVSTFS